MFLERASRLISDVDNTGNRTVKAGKVAANKKKILDPKAKKIPQVKKTAQFQRSADEPTQHKHEEAPPSPRMVRPHRLLRRRIALQRELRRFLPWT
jgi:hypothetical protein